MRWDKTRKERERNPNFNRSPSGEKVKRKKESAWKLLSLTMVVDWLKQRLNWRKTRERFPESGEWQARGVRCTQEWEENRTFFPKRSAWTFDRLQSFSLILCLCLQIHVFILSLSLSLSFSDYSTRPRLLPNQNLNNAKLTLLPSIEYLSQSFSSLSFLWLSF